MASGWNIKKLRECVIADNQKNAALLVDIANSLGRARQIFDYHKCLARDAFSVFNAVNDPSGTEFARHVFGCIEDEDVLWRAGLVSEANLIACISITRNSFDSFGQLVNGLVVLTPCKGNFYIHHVKNALPAGELKDKLNDAISSNWFGYVNVFMNTVKHRQLISHNASISFVDDDRGGKVYGFECRGEFHPAYWVREMLEGTVGLQNSLVSCG